MVVVDLLRAVLADLHEEGVELRHDERDPDSEACVRHYRAGVASMAWGWTRCPVPLTVRGTQALVSFAPLAFKLFYRYPS